MQRVAGADGLVQHQWWCNLEVAQNTWTAWTVRRLCLNSKVNGPWQSENFILPIGSGSKQEEDRVDH